MTDVNRSGSPRLVGRALVASVLVVASVGFWTSAADLACSSANDARLCTDIPDGGCPLSNGVACEDPTCRATYACEPGGLWVLSQVCPPNDASIAEPIPTPEAGPRIDAPADDLGCPELEMPDCPADVAAACGPGCCGCEDLFVCQQGAWVPYGSCTADGGIHVDPAR